MIKLELGTTVTVELDGKETRFLIVPPGSDGKERLSLRAPLTHLLKPIAVGDTLTWQTSMPGSRKIHVKLVKVETSKERREVQ